MEDFLEILKYTIPSLVVFITVYFLIKKFFNAQYNLAALKFKQEQLDKSMPLKFQAYERMAMFCERISVDNLSFRLSSANTDAAAMSRAMLIAIQQEFDHNMSQQIYISNSLWEIVSLAKEQTQNLVSQAASALPQGASAYDLIRKVSELQEKTGGDIIAKAKKAIKKEVDLVF